MSRPQDTEEARGFIKITLAYVGLALVLRRPCEGGSGAALHGFRPAPITSHLSRLTSY
jgi:hypothetical protein